jgi:formaldehyde-activating enzyme involved in methanogenesis
MRLENCDKGESGNNEFSIQEVQFIDDEALIAYSEKSRVVVYNYHELQKSIMEVMEKTPDFEKLLKDLSTNLKLRDKLMKAFKRFND